MDKFLIGLLLPLWSCVLFHDRLVNSDPGHGLTGGWGNDGTSPVAGGGGGGSGGGESASRNQLTIWSNNRTYYDAGPARATNLHGMPVPSLTASQAIGTRGHVLMQDFVLIEKMASFNRERIPERSVHAKGAGAHGHFVVTHDVSQYTKARFLQGIGKKTRLFVRYSTVGGELGSADTAVDPNGFAIKFYTEDGNYDLVGNNIETFPIRDPMLFNDMSRSRKRNPQTNLKDQTMWWDFVSYRPESTLHTLHLFSDIGRPNSYRSMDGFGVHAFKCVNDHGEVVFCKFVWKTLQPAPALTHERNSQLAGSNPEYKTQDLYDAISRGDFPKWDLFLQVMTVKQAQNYPRNPFDITRTWRLSEYPLIPVGRLVLDRNPVNFFAEVEQAAFTPSNLVPGIEPSPDRILAGRMMSYPDAQRYRLGINHPQLPINRPESPVNSYLRDGKACFGDNGGGAPNYFPNSFGGSVADTVGAGQVTFHVEGVVDRFDIPEDEHDEARVFLQEDVGPEHRARLISSIAIRLKDAREDVRERVFRNIFYPISKQFGDELRHAVERYLREGNSGSSDNRDRRIGSKF